MTRARIGKATLFEAGDDLRPERSRRLEQQPRKIRLTHALILHRASDAVNQIDRRSPVASRTVDVHVARPEEYDEAGRVTALAYREFVKRGESSWEEYLDHIADVAGRADRSLVLVAYEDGRIVGSATLELGERIDDDDPPLASDEAHVRMLGVHPDARGRGVARALMDVCFAHARAAGRSRLTLNTTERMKTAKAMYEAMGFRRLPDRVFPDGFVLLGYEKDVPPGA
jgi:ribosomal protein S18 acetylase RimI-like enzyme